MKTGVCSVTFRQLSPDRIAALAEQAGLDAIEWGGDVHVPPGNGTAAQNVGRLTAEAGLEVCSYGSYYSILKADGRPDDFAPVLESTLALGADTLRIWPGTQASATASDRFRRELIKKLRSDLEMAASQGVRLALEFHAHTLCDSVASTLALLDEIKHPNLYSYWQPMYWEGHADQRAREMKKMAHALLNLHVFHWQFDPAQGSWADGIDRRPLDEGRHEWQTYLSVELPPGEHVALLEFVRGDCPEQFLEDAATLHRLLG